MRFPLSFSPVLIRYFSPWSFIISFVHTAGKIAPPVHGGLLLLIIERCYCLLRFVKYCVVAFVFSSFISLRVFPLSCLRLSLPVRKKKKGTRSESNHTVRPELTITRKRERVAGGRERWISPSTWINVQEVAADARKGWWNCVRNVSHPYRWVYSQ